MSGFPRQPKDMSLTAIFALLLENLNKQRNSGGQKTKVLAGHFFPWVIVLF